MPSHAPYGAYGPGPYGSAPPPKKRKHPIAIALVAALCIGMGSCVSWCGYEMYKAQTPEGKREIAAQEKKDEATLASYIDMLEHVRKNIPAKVENDTRCAAKLPGFLPPPIVDSIYLDTVGRPKTEWEADLAALEKVRSSSFSDRILLRAATGAVPKAADAGLEFYTATTDAKTLADYKQLYVIVVDEVIAPIVSGSDWTGGSLVGGLVVYDVATQKPLCQTPINAASSASISYGGGVRIKVRGIPTPTVGDTGLVDAVAKDFKKNVETAVREGAKRIGASG
jgi:hypothetical protein